MHFTAYTWSLCKETHIQKSGFPNSGMCILYDEPQASVAAAGASRGSKSP